MEREKKMLWCWCDKNDNKWLMIPFPPKWLFVYIQKNKVKL